MRIVRLKSNLSVNLSTCNNPRTLGFQKISAFLLSVFISFRTEKKYKFVKGSEEIENKIKRMYLNSIVTNK